MSNTPASPAAVEPQLGGSYVRQPETGELQRQQHTAEPEPSLKADPAQPPQAAEPTPEA